MSGPQLRRLFTPAQLLVAGYAIVTLLGAMFFMLSFATTDGQGLSFVDALFMSASAVCVTGLAVVSPSADLTVFGQTVLMLLIQVGGIGFMTIASMMAILLGRRISIRDRLLLKEALNQHSLDGIVRLVMAITIATLAIEVLGGLILAVEFMPYMPGGTALYFGFFHAVSAFNNAGFDLFGDSLVRFQENGIVQLTIAGLFMLGGLGYIVLLNVIQTRGQFSKMSLHTKLVLVVSAILLVSATVIIWLLEYQHFAAQGMTWPTQVLNSFFQGATVRTAGFNSVDLTVLADGTIYLMMLLMFIGASSVSTGGGIKTTTAAVAAMLVYHVIRGRNEIVVFGRTISTDFVIKSFVLIMLSVTVVMISTFVLLLTESAGFLVVLFESVSAFATVGLSLGLTPELSTAGKVMIIVTMFAGRVGPLTLFFAMSKQIQQRGYRHPEDKIIIG